MLNRVSHLFKTTTGIDEDQKKVKQSWEYVNRMFFNPGLSSGKNDKKIRKTNNEQIRLKFENKFGKPFKDMFVEDIIGTDNEHVLQKLIVHADQNKVHIISKGPPDNKLFTQSICQLIDSGEGASPGFAVKGIHVREIDGVKDSGAQNISSVLKNIEETLRYWAE